MRFALLVIHPFKSREGNNETKEKQNGGKLELTTVSAKQLNYPKYRNLVSVEYTLLYRCPVATANPARIVY